MGSLLVGCFSFSFSFSSDGKIRLHFYFFQTPGIPVGLCSLVFPLPFLFILTFSSWLPLHSAFPPSLSPFYLLVYIIRLQSGCLFDLLGLFSAEL